MLDKFELFLYKKLAFTLEYGQVLHHSKFFGFGIEGLELRHLGGLAVYGLVDC
jgi:hypothetical protein